MEDDEEDKQEILDEDIDHLFKLHEENPLSTKSNSYRSIY
jgi:hypothetical protein